MKKPIRLSRLFFLLAVLLTSVLLLEWTKVPAEKDHAPLMRDAANRARVAFDALKEERLRRGYPINIGDDPNETGMIGDMYTAITTTLGSLESKRSTTNPNFAAAVVDMLVSLNLRPGDRVAANLSGSFPCANISVLCAMDAMGLEGAAIPSVGASTYGANLPELTFPDMESFLVSKGLVTNRTSAFSMGGDHDLGLEFPEDLREEIVLRLTGLGYELLSYADLNENIEERIRRFSQEGSVQCFINVGGNLTSFGEGSGMTTISGGIQTFLPEGENGNGLVQRYLREGVPVLHLLNMKGLMADWDLPFDPIPLPKVGQGGVYWHTQYSPWLLASVCLIDAAALFIFFAPRKRGQAKRQFEKRSGE